MTQKTHYDKGEMSAEGEGEKNDLHNCKSKLEFEFYFEANT